MSSLMITEVTVFTGTGDVLTNGRVRVDGGRITEVGSSLPIPGDAMVLRGQGQFLMAGFIDAHSHLGLVTVPERPELHPDAPFMAVQNAAMKLASGVTTVRDVGGLLHVDLALNRAIRRGLVPGPRMICSGQVVCPTGGHIHYFGREADGPDEVRKAVREQFRAGAHFAKIMISGGIANVGEDPDKLHMHEDEVRAAVAVAKENRTTVAAHIYPARGIRMAAECGVTSIEHAIGLEDAVLDVLVQHGVWVVPTQCVYQWMAENRGHWCAEEKASAAARVLEVKTPRLRNAIKAGVRIGAGTDCGRHFPPSDFATELVLLSRAGLTPEQVLLVATRENAELLGISNKIGTVEPGKVADLVLLGSNPLENLENARDVRMIIQGGQVIDPKALLKKGRV
jgi:imidazolonepropionase-like amidohydrolase